MVEGITPTASRQVIVASPAFGDRQFIANANNYTTQRVQPQKKNSFISTIADFSNLVLTVLSIACTVAWGILMFRQFRTQQHVERELGNLTKQPTIEPLEIRFSGIPDLTNNFVFNQGNNITLKETTPGSKELYVEFKDIKPITQNQSVGTDETLDASNLVNQNRLLTLGINNSINNLKDQKLTGLIDNLMSVDLQGIQSQIRDGTQDNGYRIDAQTTFENIMGHVEKISNQLEKNQALKQIGLTVAQNFHEGLKQDLKSQLNFTLDHSVTGIVERANTLYSQLTRNLKTNIPEERKRLNEQLKQSGLEFLMPPESLLLEILAEGFTLNSKNLMRAGNLPARFNDLKRIVDKIETKQQQPVTV
jgi:hypothetical protein